MQCLPIPSESFFRLLYEHNKEIYQSILQHEMIEICELSSYKYRPQSAIAWLENHKMLYYST